MSLPPTPHEPPAPSESSWTSSVNRAVVAQFAPPGKYERSRGFYSTFPGVSLPNAFAVQTAETTDVWIGDSGASRHMTNDASQMYDARPRSPDEAEITISDGTRRRVKQIGKINLGFHGRTDEPITLCDVSYVPGSGFNYFSFRKARETHIVILDAVRSHNVGNNLTFPRVKSGSYLLACRLRPGTVGAKRRTALALASQIS